MNIKIPDLTDEQARAKLEALRTDILALLKSRGVAAAFTLVDATPLGCAALSFAHLDAPWSLTNIMDAPGDDGPEDRASFERYMAFMSKLSDEDRHVLGELTKKMYIALLSGMKDTGLHLVGMSQVMASLLSFGVDKPAE